MAIHGADSVTDRAPFRPPWGRCGASGGGGVAIKCAYQVTARTPSLSPEDGCGASGGKRCDKRFLIGRCAPRGVDATAGRIQVQNFGGLANRQRWGTFERIGSLGSSGGAQVGDSVGGGCRRRRRRASGMKSFPRRADADPAVGSASRQGAYSVTATDPLRTSGVDSTLAVGKWIYDARTR